MREFMDNVMNDFSFYDDRDFGRSVFLGQNAVAVEFGMTSMKAKGLLIAASAYSLEMNRRITKLQVGGYNLNEIMEEIGLRRVFVHFYLPYMNISYKLDELLAYADRLYQ